MSAEKKLVKQKQALVWACDGYQEAQALKGALVSNCKFIGQGIWKGHLNAVTDEGKIIDMPNFEFHEGQAYFYQLSTSSTVKIYSVTLLLVFKSVSCRNLSVSVKPL